ncbi:MAG: hypothetical protein J6E48_12840 [Prevotella sp.]|nr:hypothetical protein [Prevotella sp.]
MSQANKMTASQLLALIERKYFRGAGLAKASRLEGEERRAYRLAQVERLLTKGSKYTPWAMYLSDDFWTADEGRKPMYEDAPLLSIAGQQTLTEDEMKRLRLIVEIAGLCHDLTLHFTFDLQEAFGIRNQDFWVTNRRLVEWLTTTEYEQIAMHTAYIMKKEAINVYAYGHYQPAQDELAELFSMEYHEPVREPYNTNMPPRTYVKTILDTLLRIERHWRRGVFQLKLRPDLVMLHDEIYGVIPLRFDRGVLEAAQALYDYMDKELRGRLTQIENEYGFMPWEKLPESAKRASAEVMTRFAEKVREVRSKYLAEGWVEDDSLAFSYLMAHAERCGHGWWREEDEAL